MKSIKSVFSNAYLKLENFHINFSLKFQFNFILFIIKMKYKSNNIFIKTLTSIFGYELINRLTVLMYNNDISTLSYINENIEKIYYYIEKQEWFLMNFKKYYFKTFKYYYYDIIDLALDSIQNKTGESFENIRVGNSLIARMVYDAVLYTFEVYDEIIPLFIDNLKPFISKIDTLTHHDRIKLLSSKNAFGSIDFENEIFMSKNISKKIRSIYTNPVF